MPVLSILVAVRALDIYRSIDRIFDLWAYLTIRFELGPHSAASRAASAG